MGVKILEYRRFDKTIIVRLDKGEEILEQVKELALKERIKLASVQALGAVDRFTVGVFKTDDKKYLANDFSGSFEIVSLNRAVVSATCEMVVNILEGTVDRYYDEQIGLNLLRF